jgi:hypothetical protein
MYEIPRKFKTKFKKDLLMFCTNYLMQSMFTLKVSGGELELQFDSKSLHKALWKYFRCRIKVEKVEAPES